MNALEHQVVSEIEKSHRIETDLESITLEIDEWATNGNWGHFSAVVKFVAEWPITVQGKYGNGELRITAVRPVW